MNISREQMALSRILALLSILSMFFSSPLLAQTESEMKLPDGLYMYDSWISRIDCGRQSIEYQKCFIVYDGTIYSPQKAINEFGDRNLNDRLTKNRKYKMILGHDNIGKVYDVFLAKNGDFIYEQLLARNIKEGPAYKVDNAIADSYGSAANPLAVPEEYRQAPTTFSNTLNDDEVAKVSRLVREKLFDLVKKRKQLKQFKIEKWYFEETKIEMLDKLSNQDEKTYIGICSAYSVSEDGVGHPLKIVFSLTTDNVRVITSNYDDEMLPDGSTIKICGMLDIDGCGKNELIIEKQFWKENEGVTVKNLEMYKQKLHEEWIRIQRITAGNRHE